MRRCLDCDALNPELTPEGVCRHRRACEARQMLRRGVPAQRAAAHAQSRDPGVFARLWRRWRTPWYKRPDRLDEIDREMYYEQADRDGVEYPPQYRGR